ncbi:CRE-NCA-2 protein, partial [Aphelenchoides avenae]
MLARRQSSNTATTSEVRAPSGSRPSRMPTTRESIAVFDMLNSFEPASPTIEDSNVNMALMDSLMKLTCLLSMVSVCMNTPSTIAAIPALQYALLVVDISCTLFLTFDAYQK